jgi:hypothetical protein
MVTICSQAASSLVTETQYVDTIFFLSRDAKETSQHEQGIKYVLYHEDKQQMYCTNDLLQFLDLLRGITCNGLLVFSLFRHRI